MTRQSPPHIARIRTVFSPGAPIDKHRLFAGRIPQVRQVINAVYQRGMHVVLYGERGVGKTSLANVLGEILDNPDLEVLGSRTINCDPTDTFSSLWRKILRELRVSVERQGTGFKAQPVRKEYSVRDLLGDTGDIVPDDIRYTLQMVEKQTMIIIDELDRLQDRAVTRLLADTIKNLSDHSVQATLVLVGVGRIP